MYIDQQKNSKRSIQSAWHIFFVDFCHSLANGNELLLSSFKKVRIFTVIEIHKLLTGACSRAFRVYANGSAYMRKGVTGCVSIGLMAYPSNYYDLSLFNIDFWLGSPTVISA